MLNPKIKHALKVVFVVLVIFGLVASFVFTGAPTRQPIETESQPEGFQFYNGPTGEPSVTGPTTAPSAAGPTAPPPTAQ